jgi:hypothetical protein
MSLTRCSARSPSASKSRRSLAELAGGVARFNVSVLRGTSCRFLHRCNDPRGDRASEVACHGESHHRFAFRDRIEHAHAEALAESSDFLQETFLSCPSADEAGRQNANDLQVRLPLARLTVSARLPIIQTGGLELAWRGSLSNGGVLA